MSEMYVPLDRPRDFVGVLSAVADILRVCWRRLLADIVILAGLWILVGGVLLGMVMRTSIASSVGADSGSLDTSASAVGATVVLMLIGVLLLMVGSFMQIVVVMAFMREYHRLQRVPERSEVRAAMKEIWAKCLGSLIVMSLIVNIASLLLFLPGIWVAVPLSLLQPARVFETLSMGDAISRSFQLVKGRWWWTFGIAICLVITMVILGGITLIPSWILMVVVAMSTEASAMTESTIIAQAASLVMQACVWYLVQTIAQIGSVVTYFAHAERLEGTSIFQKVDEIGATDAA